MTQPRSCTQQFLSSSSSSIKDQFATEPGCCCASMSFVHISRRLDPGHLTVSPVEPVGGQDLSAKSEVFVEITRSLSIKEVDLKCIVRDKHLCLGECASCQEMAGSYRKEAFRMEQIFVFGIWLEELFETIEQQAWRSWSIGFCALVPYLATRPTTLCLLAWHTGG